MLFSGTKEDDSEGDDNLPADEGGDNLPADEGGDNLPEENCDNVPADEGGDIFFLNFYFIFYVGTTKCNLYYKIFWISLYSFVRHCRERERNVLFNHTLNTFYLWLYGVRHMVKDHSDSEKGNLLPPHRLVLSINSKGSFICTIPQTGYHIPRPL